MVGAKLVERTVAVHNRCTGIFVRSGGVDLMNAFRFQAVHFIGIGGTGLSAIARVLLERGFTVSGSDRQETVLLEGLRDAGAQIFIGHNARQISGAGVIVRSSAIPDDNPEVQAALQKGIPVLKRAEFLGDLMEERVGIAVAGTHGKTTTTGMLAWMFSTLDQDPTFIIGGVLDGLGVNARAGDGPHFIIEADEYDRMFLGLKPKVAVITNIEYDHPDCYPTEADYYQAFVEFSRRLEGSGALIVCADDPGAARLAREDIQAFSVFTYGIQADDAQYRAVNLNSREGRGYSFDVRFGEQWVHVNLQVPGEHNVRNALAALLVAKYCELDIVAAAKTLDTFSGVGRRFDIQAEIGGITLIDDYGHHPTEIRTTLAAARDRYPGRRLWAVWQPHTYSRTRALADSWMSAFDDADKVVVTEIFASRERPPLGGYSAKRVVDQMGHPDVTFCATLEQTWNYLVPRLKQGDVLIVFSAGDADLVSQRVVQTLFEKDSQFDRSSKNAKEQCHA
jgi:UDP-N-acetylmuramate--alanine ligase